MIASAPATAILSAAVRLPQANCLDTLGDLLVSGRSATSVGPPPGRPWNEPRVNRSVSRHAGWLDQPILDFDHAAFGIERQEACWMDPQQRLVLELAAEALTRADLRGERNIGVFLGVSHACFQEIVVDLLQRQPAPASVATGGLRNLLAARVAWQFDLTGPAVVVDTACSSTLVALHQATQAIAAGDCRYALVGGVFLLLTPTPLVVMSRAGALSASGVCRPFDPAADGFVIGEGAGLFLVGPADRPPLAWVRGTAINNDGRTKNPMAPRLDHQVAVMRTAWGRAGQDPSLAAYVEAHGTGTRLGDGVEARALAQVFAAATPIGSVKSQLGHLMSAAGVASIAKALVVLRHGLVPPTPNVTTTHVGLGALRLTTEPEHLRGTWVGINGFGFGGTNAHVVLERGAASDLGSWSDPYRRVRCWPGDVAGPEPTLQPPPNIARLGWEPYETGAALTSPAAAFEIDARKPLDLEASLAVVETLRTTLRDGARSVLLRTSGAFGGQFYAAALVGLVQALPAEFPGLRVTATDVEDGATPTNPAPEGLAVWRNGRWWRPIFLPVATPSAEASPSNPAGRWLVVGASGGIGRALIPSLLAVGAEVVAVGRSADPGLSVPWVQADTTTEAERILDEAGPLTGIVVLTGAVSPGSFLARSTSDTRATWQAKLGVVGALATALDRRGLDPEVVLFTSIAAEVEHARGLVDYGAANAALDALALSRQAAGKRWTAIRWDAWSVGMGVALAGSRPTVVPTATALELWTRLRGGVWRVEGAAASAVPDNLEGRECAQAGSAETSITAPPELIERVRQLAAAHLEIDPAKLGDDVSLFSLGLDSLSAVDLVGRLEHEGFGVLPVTLLFEASTVASLATQLAQGSAPNAAIPVAAAPRQPNASRFPLGDTQRALLTQSRLEPDFVPFAFLRIEFRGRLDPAVVAAAAQDIVDRHPMLRVSFADGDNLIRPHHRAWFEQRDHINDEDVLAEPLDQRGPLQVLLAPGVLALRLHHAAGDGWSLHVVARDLLRRCAGVHLAPLEGNFRDQLATLPPPTNEQTDTKPPWFLAGIPSGRRRFCTRTLEFEAATELTARAHAAGVTLPALLLAAWATTLSAWTHHDDLTVGVAVARRNLARPGAGDIVGCLADTVPIGVTTVRSSTASSCLEATACTLQPKLAAALMRAPQAVVAASLSFSKFPLPTPDALPIVITAVVAATASGNTRLGLTAWEWDGRLGLSCNYPESLLSRATVEQILDTLIQQLAPDPAAVDRILAPIAAVAATDPHRPALIGDGPMSFGSLWDAAGSVADSLVGAGRLVGIELDMGTRAVVAMLGVLRAGRAIAAVTPSDPRGRSRLVGLGINTVLDAASLDERLETVPTPTTAATAPATGARSSAYAALIFTSGSTGEPKPIPLVWSALADYLDDAAATFRYSPSDRCAAPAPLVFDAALRQVLAPLRAGAAVLPIPPDLAQDPRTLAALLRQETMTVWSSVPSLWARLVRQPLPALRLVQLGGEALAPELVAAAPPGSEVWNLYGPTEATINALRWRVDRSELAAAASSATSVPIGAPLPGVRTRVQGGELWLAGPRVTPGTWGGDRPGRFVVVDGERWYRTCDRVEVDLAGRFVWLGRCDDQLKVRGHRIEPGEVIAALRRLPGVVDAAVFVDGDVLVATVEGTLPDNARDQLAEMLPAAALPHRLSSTTALPRTASGKLDRSHLAGSEADRSSPAFDPRAAVARAWSAVLGTTPEENTDFFEAGGDSLRVVDLFDILAENFEVLPRPRVLYETPRFGDLVVALLDHAANHRAQAANPRLPKERDDWRPLSPVQLGFLLAGEASSTWVGWSRQPRIFGLRRAVATLVDRHPLLRLEFRGSSWRARPEITLPLVEIDDPLGDTRVAREAEGLRVLPFGQWAMRAIHTSDETFLLLAAHHAVGDARSCGILFRELDTLLAGRALPPLRGTYADHTATADPGSDRNFWTHHLEGPILDLPPGPQQRAERLLPATSAAAVLEAWWRTLVRATDHTDLTFGLVLDGRDGTTPDLARIVGPFAWLVPLRLTGPNAAAALAAVRAQHPTAGELARWFPDVEPARRTGAQNILSLFSDDGRIETLAGSLPQATRIELVVRFGPAGARARLTTGCAGLPDPALLLDWLHQMLIRRPAVTGLVAYLPPGFEPPPAALLGRVTTPIGTSLIGLLPITPDQLSTTVGLPAKVEAVVTRLRRAGADLTSLAGRLPALTAFTTAVPAARLTTGHAATVVAVVATVREVVRRFPWRRPPVLGILGCGSIGLGALNVLLRELEPAGIVLCDRIESRARLAPLASSLGATLIFDPNQMEADLVIGATSAPGVLDVTRLRPGTRVVDDSFPPCLDVEVAIARMRQQRDLVVVGGGLLQFAKGEIAVTPKVALLPSLIGLPGCQLEPLLWSQIPDPPLLQTPVDTTSINRALALAEAFGLVAAPLHLGEWRLPDDYALATSPTLLSRER